MNRRRAPEFSAGRIALGALLAVCGFLPVHAQGVLPGPSELAVDKAIAAPFISYRRNFSGGAHTNGAWYGGASIALAVASHAGNTRADARLLGQIRHTLTAGNEPTSNGGYPAQHERHVTGMFVIVKNTPRIWDQLTTAEKARIDLIMKATLVANAFTTSDNNPFIKASSQQYSLDADDNLNRNWNPNYREGMIGGVLTGMAYFGGPAPTTALLAGYDHAAFVAELAANNLPNMHETFNWKAANPTSKAPSASQIEAGVNQYLYFGSALADYMTIYESLAANTFGRTVNAGLNDGAGISGAGKIVSGAETLPNKGAEGMLKEFDSVDADGPRSSFIYAFDGYRPHLTNQIALIVSGFWAKNTPIPNRAVQLMTVGVTDLWYKAEKGYIGYSKGSAQGAVSEATHGESRGFTYNRSLWTDVLQPYHGVPDSAAFAIGARVQTAAEVGISSAASATASLLGTLPAGALGTVLAGPIEADGVSWWRVQFDSGLTGWVDQAELAAAPASESLTAIAGGAWLNKSIAAQTGSFTISFNLRPLTGAVDAVAGLSASAATAYGHLAVAVRAAPGGTFDARDGGSYRATGSLAYQAGVTYRVQVAVDVPAKRYTVSIAPPGGAAVEIARDFAFRTEQAAVASLANLAVTAQTGSHTVSGIVLGGGPPSAPTGLRVIEIQQE